MYVLGPRFVTFLIFVVVACIGKRHSVTIRTLRCAMFVDEHKYFGLQRILDQVFFPPFNLCPDPFVQEHERRFEDGVGTGDFGSHRQVLRNEYGKNEGVTNGKQPERRRRRRKQKDE